MKMQSDATASLSDVKQLTYFRIYKSNTNEQHGQIKLFSNGNQQCPIKVKIVAADAAGNPINLTPDDLRGALKLIRYDDGALLGSGGDGYAYSFVDNGFTWTESVIPTPDRHENESARDDKVDASAPPRGSSPQDEVNIVTLFVSAAPGSSGLVVAARFEPVTGLYFTTNSSADDPGGEGEDGQFNSSVEVLLADPPYLSATDFGASPAGVISGHPAGNSNNFYWATEYYLEPKLNGRAVPLRAVGANASAGSGGEPSGYFGVYAHSSDVFGSVKWGISYYGYPGATDAYPAAFSSSPLSYVSLTPRRSGVPDSGESSTVTTTVHAEGGVDTVTTTVHFGGRDATVGDRGSARADYFLKAMYSNCVGKIVGANKNRVVIGIIKGNLDGQFKNSSGGAISDVSSTTMHIQDAYGNDHTLSLSYDGAADEVTIG